jgi:hypothetical protein
MKSPKQAKAQSQKADEYSQGMEKQGWGMIAISRGFFWGQ